MTTNAPHLIGLQKKTQKPEALFTGGMAGVGITPCPYLAWQSAGTCIPIPLQKRDNGPSKSLVS